jgi:diphosphomevalonate decarboxylase
VMKAVIEWRKGGLPVCYTIDAGPNVHVLCLGTASLQVDQKLREIDGVQNVLAASPGGPARLENS